MHTLLTYSRSNKVWLLIIVLFVLGLSSACVRTVGGSCTYADFDGQAEVLEIHQNNTEKTQEYTLRFTLSKQLARKAQSISGLMINMFNVWKFVKPANHPILFGAKVGDHFDTQARVITRGTCTPASFEVKSLVVPDRASIYFAAESTELTVTAKTILDQYQRAYRHSRKQGHVSRLRLEGNTSLKGSREYNLMLGTRLADAAKDYLIRHGVLASDIDVVSFGEEQPQCNTSMSKACQAQNWRVDIIFKK